MHKLLTCVFLVLEWVQIAISPILLSLLLACIIYLFIPTTIGEIIGVVIFFVGIVIGIFWVKKISKTTSANHLLARLYHKPEFKDDDSLEDE